MLFRSVLTTPFVSALQVIRSHWKNFFGWLGRVLQHLNLLFTNPLKAVKLLWRDLVDGIKGIFTGFVEFVKRMALRAVRALLEPFTHIDKRIPFVGKMGALAQKAVARIDTEMAKLTPKLAARGAEAGTAWSDGFVPATDAGLDALDRRVAGVAASAQKATQAVYNGNTWVDAKTGKPIADQQGAWEEYRKRLPRKMDASDRAGAMPRKGTRVTVQPKPTAKPPKTTKPPKPDTDAFPTLGSLGVTGPEKEPDKVKTAAQKKAEKERKEAAFQRGLATIPIGLQTKEERIRSLEARAGDNKRKLNKALKMELEILKDEREVMKKRLRNKRATAETKLAIEKQITAIDQRMAAIGKTLGGKLGPGGIELWTPQMRVRLAKTQRTTKNLKDDQTVLRAEQQYLRNLLKNRKLDAKQKAAIHEELTRVHKQLMAIQEKIKDQLEKEKEEKEKIAQLQFGLLNERSSFFASFAPNVFQTDESGTNQPGSSGNQPGTQQPAPSKTAPTPGPREMWKGGIVMPQRFAGGGIVSGVSGRDKVPALLTAGEAVLSRGSVGALRDVMRNAGKPVASQAPVKNVTVENHQHFQAPPTTDGAREARYAEISLRSVFASE